MKNISLKKIFSVIFMISFLAGSAWVLLNTNDVLDWYRMRGYQPPSKVVQLAEQTGMSSYGQRLFFVNRPLVEPKERFVNDCTESEQTIVLGCYKSRVGIYVLAVDDPRLEGVEQVTAAHEMLHAGYERLSASQKKQINGLLEAYYKKINDPRLNEIIGLYRANKADINNELHSIIGTEFSDLTPELDDYYKQYFANRKLVVGYAQKYQAVFTDKKLQIERDDQKIQALANDIMARNQELKITRDQIDAEQSRLTSLRNSGDITAYNLGVRPFNQSVREYNESVKNNNARIDEYRALLADRNQLASELQTLNKALDARVTGSSQSTIGQ